MCAYAWHESAWERWVLHCVVNPEHALVSRIGWDAKMRRGLFWEPIANSPPSYVLVRARAPQESTADSVCMHTSIPSESPGRVPRVSDFKTNKTAASL